MSQSESNLLLCFDVNCDSGFEVDGEAILEYCDLGNKPFDHRGDVGLQGIQEIVLLTEHLVDGLNGHFLQEFFVDRPGVAGVPGIL